MTGLLVHGLAGDLAPGDWPALTAPELAAVVAAFPAAGTLLRVGRPSPRPQSAASAVTTTTGQWVVKRHAAAVRRPADLVPEHRFGEHLAAAGLPVPPWARTGDGATALGRDGWTYEVQRAGAGTDRYRDAASWEPYRDPADAAAAGGLLARLHAAAAELPEPARGPRLLSASGALLRCPDLVAAVAAWAAGHPPTARQLARRPWQDDLARSGAQPHADAAAAVRDLPPLWGHHDWHGSNLLWAPDGAPRVTAVFDLGLADLGWAAYDIATALERACVGWLAPAPELRTDDAAALLAGYEEVRPLPGPERAAVAALLPVVHVEYALSELAYYGELLDSPVRAATAYERYLVGHLDWWARDPAGRRARAFLEAWAEAG